VSEHDFVRVADAASPPITTEGRERVTEPTTTGYHGPRLVFVGSMVEMVQSGPSGNRYETYRCSYWYDR
jgi:hypothetical protein